MNAFTAENLTQTNLNCFSLILYVSKKKGWFPYTRNAGSHKNSSITRAELSKTRPLARHASPSLPRNDYLLGFLKGNLIKNNIEIPLFNGIILGLEPHDMMVTLVVKTMKLCQKIYMKIEFSSQRKEMFLFLTTNMATLTSCANQQDTISDFLFFIK